MGNKAYFITLALLLLASCGKPKADVDNTSNSEQAATQIVSETQNSSDATQNEGKPDDVEANSWGYDDKPSPDADLTREPPLEVIGGLVHDVGNLIEGEKRIYVLKLKNTSDKPWKLQSIDADCSCTNIDGIPGGVHLKPGEEFPVALRIDGGKIAAGKFEKHIYLHPLEYRQVTVKILGTVERFFVTIPTAHRIVFNTHGDPNAKWEGSIEIMGIDKAKDNLELSLIKENVEHSYIQATLEKQENKSWKLVAKPRKPLPYALSFHEDILIKVLEPKDKPNIRIVVQGNVGMSLRWKNAPMAVTESDFKDGVVQRSFQLGIDINDPASTQNPRLMKQVEKVDWKKLFDTLEFKAPEGVKCEKKFTRFGVKLEVTAPRTAFSEKGTLKIENGCNGNWEGIPISLRIKK